VCRFPVFVFPFTRSYRLFDRLIPHRNESGESLSVLNGNGIMLEIGRHLPVTPLNATEELTFYVIITR
jgi:hypothetical protein